MELPELPEIRELVVRYARILERLSGELGERPLVLPNARFFPDHFDGSLESFARLTERMALHAGMSDVPIRVSGGVQENTNDCSSGSCSSGGCGTPLGAEESVFLTDEGDHWVINGSEAELRHPIVMTTRLARALAEIFLYETQEEGAPLEEPLGVTIDLAAIALGFGVLLLEGSYVYSKSCGGPSVAKFTELGCNQLAIAFGCFACRGDHSRRAALKELGATQRELLTSAFELLDSNPHIARALRSHPEQLAMGAFEIADVSPSLLRLFSRKKQEPAAMNLDASLEELERSLYSAPAPRTKQPAPDPERDELRALVDEAFGGSSASK